ncbi:hypothetical protein BDN70DRAFT_971934 [Pholiota conissans]|uniref:Uncharacterized protein n=1 Tax=Pholiota conissans TaxID=109636 RepID=A0A9P5YP69_9AGAR|nr:hypothetical protein BDN70DRAFT_971934 [Pholiota conissans]
MAMRIAYLLGLLLPGLPFLPFSPSPSSIRRSRRKFPKMKWIFILRGRRDSPTYSSHERNGQARTGGSGFHETVVRRRCKERKKKQVKDSDKLREMMELTNETCRRRSTRGRGDRDVGIDSGGLYRYNEFRETVVPKFGGRERRKGNDQSCAKEDGTMREETTKYGRGGDNTPEQMTLAIKWVNSTGNVGAEGGNNTLYTSSELSKDAA